MADPLDSGTVYTYRRISRDPKETGSCSLDWQKDTINKWLASRGMVSDGDLCDTGVSASIPLDQRDDGKKLVAQAVHDGDVIVVAKLDRIFRDVEDFRARLRVWRSQGVALVSADGGLDLTTASGRFFATLQAAFSEYERELIAERTVAAQETRAAKGLRTSPVALYGWMHVPTGAKSYRGDVEYAVAPCDDEQIVIEQIIVMREACLSLRRIAECLTATKAPTRKSKGWTHSTVQTILDNLDRHRAEPPNTDRDDMSWPRVRKWIEDERSNQR